MRLSNRPRGRSSTGSRSRGRSSNVGTSRGSSRDSRRIINASGTLPRVSNKTPRHARSSLKKLRVPARHSLTPITHRPLTHAKRAPQHRISRVRHTAITKQRIHKNRRLIVTTARHVTSGSRYALTRSLHTVNKLAKERPHAPQRPGAAHVIAHHQQALSTPTRNQSNPNERPQLSNNSHAQACQKLHSHIIYDNQHESTKTPPKRKHDAITII